jgi:hypothetical protein
LKYNHSLARSTMLSQITRTLSRTTSNVHFKTNIFKSLSNQQFSTLVPGVGKGKTSTGLVSLCCRLFATTLSLYTVPWYCTTVHHAVCSYVRIVPAKYVPISIPKILLSSSYSSPLYHSLYLSIIHPLILPPCLPACIYTFTIYIHT